jgi:hypothetical protein
METYLAILSHHEALAWVLTSQMMAFSARKGSGIADLRRGDELLLYTTRNCLSTIRQRRDVFAATAAEGGGSASSELRSTAGQAPVVSKRAA